MPLAFLLPDGPANATDAYSLRAEVARVVETILSDAEASPTGWLGGPLNPGARQQRQINRASRRY